MEFTPTGNFLLYYSYYIYQSVTQCGRAYCWGQIVSADTRSHVWLFLFNPSSLRSWPTGRGFMWGALGWDCGCLPLLGDKWHKHFLVKTKSCIMRKLMKPSDNEKKSCICGWMCFERISLSLNVPHLLVLLKHTEGQVLPIEHHQAQICTQSCLG